MPKYHPIDVRYKGPSTAYRGSAKQHTSSFKKVVKPSKTTKSEPAAAPSPWDGAKDKPQQQAASSDKAGSTPKDTTGKPISVKSIYAIVLGIIFLSLFLR